MRRFFLLLLSILVLCCPVFAESSVPQVQTTATVDSDSRCSITMTANLRLEDNIRGVTLLLPEGARSVTLNGNSVNPHQNRISLDGITGGQAGAYPITVTYEIPEAVSDVDEVWTLKVPLLTGFSYPVERMSFTVTLPGAVDYAPTFTGGYLQESIESQLSYVVRGNLITGTVATPLKDHDTLSMTLPVTEDMFPRQEPLPSTLAFDRMGMLLCAGLALLYWLITMAAAPILRERETVPPPGISAGELGSRLVLAPMDLTMMVLTWAQLGYLIIESTNTRKVILHKRMDMGNERSDLENRWFQTLFHRRARETASGLRYARLCQQAALARPSFRAILRPNSGNPLLLRILSTISVIFAGVAMGDAAAENPLLRLGLMLVLGVLSGIAAWRIQKGAIYLHLRKRPPFWSALLYTAVLLVCGLVSRQMPIALGAAAFSWLSGLAAGYSGKRSELGRQLSGEILGLRHQLTHIPTEELNRILKSNPYYFYDLVPSAMALGVERRFARRMGSGDLPPCGWFVTSLDTPRSAEEWCKLLRQAVRNMDRADHRPMWQKILSGQL